MAGSSHTGHPTTLRDYIQVVRRRKWIILEMVVLVPTAAVLFSFHQQKLFQASAQVLLSSQNLANQLTGTQSTGINLQPDRIAQTQAEIARVPLVAQRVLKHVAGTGLTPQGFLGTSSVSTATNADILTFDVTNHDPVLARRLVDAYAAAYTVYRLELDTSAIVRARAGVEARIKQLVRAGDKQSALYASLVDRDQTLATMQALQTTNASVVQQADHAVQVQPRTTRNAVLAIALGIVLGIGIAFLWEALDTRVRTAQEIGEKLGGLPLLARIPEPSKNLRTHHQLVMVEEPSGIQAETFRMLRTNLEFVTLDRDVRTLMVTSAVEQEGKSTTVANLAVALARSGRRVVLVDLDLRRPFIHKFFDLDGPGLTEVVLGRATLDQALKRVTLVDPPEKQSLRGRLKNGNGNGTAPPARGMLVVLPAGPVPPDPGDFVGKQAVGRILAALRERADFVLIDAPPVLHVGDALTLSAKVDGIIAVTRMKLVRRQMVNEFGRQLASVPTPVLGFVLTGAGDEAGYGDAYGYGYEYGYAPRPLERRHARERESV